MSPRVLFFCSDGEVAIECLRGLAVGTRGPWPFLKDPRQSSFVLSSMEIRKPHTDPGKRDLDPENKMLAGKRRCLMLVIMLKVAGRWQRLPYWKFQSKLEGYAREGSHLILWGWV